MKFNFFILLIAAVIPMITGSIWYNPKVFGTAWIKSTGLTEEELRKANMVKVLILTYVFSFLLAFALSAIVIHQFGVMSVLVDEPGFNDPNSEIAKYYVAFMEKYGRNFRTFKHGALHGTISGITIALPIIGTLALFERKSAKYILIHTGYWMLTLALMGGVICQWL